MSVIEVRTYTPFPKQQEFHRNPAKYRLFGGAAGPGKSRSLLEEACLQANETPGVNTLLLRRTFPELESTLIDQFLKHVPREMYRSYNETKRIVEWWNASTTRFGYLQREKDVYQYQGTEFLFIGFDELTHFTLKQWQYLTTRNRCPVAGTYPNMAGATNPGNIGHRWVKALWIDKRPADGMEAGEYDPKDYAFIPALISDNPIYAHDQNYIKVLQRLPKHLRDALLRGDWNVFAGQYFDNWDSATMVERPEGWDVKPWWTKWISIDWGKHHPAAVYWHTIDDKGRTLTYREFVRNGLSPKNLAGEIVDRSRAFDDPSGKRSEKISDVYLSPDAFADRTSEKTIAEQIGEVLTGAGLPYPSRADNDRVGGWMLMYQMLDAGYWRVGTSCPALIRCLPSLIRDEKKTEDIAKMDDPASESGMLIDGETAAGDDPADAARYGLKSYHSPGRKPFEVRVRENLEERIGMPLAQVNPDQYTNVMIQRAVVVESEKRSEKPMRLIHGRRRR